MDGFSAFWQSYPRKDARKDAMKAWQQVCGDAHLPEILTALSWQRQRPDWVKDGGQYVPLPATWLRGERWTDERPEQPQVTSKTARVLDAASRWAQR